MRGMPITPLGDSIRRRSCGNAEVGVILSPSASVDKLKQTTQGHLMDDITAEVDEREEYSNNFDEIGDRTDLQDDSEEQEKQHPEV